MRQQGNNPRRPRGRSNRKPQLSPRSQTYDSNGPDVRVRGNAHQVYEKYLNLARDATSSGDRIGAESYYQYAEHYFRLLNDTTDPHRSGDGSRGNGPRDRFGQPYRDHHGQPFYGDPYGDDEPMARPGGDQPFRGERGDGPRPNGHDRNAPVASAPGGEPAGGPEATAPTAAASVPAPVVREVPREPGNRAAPDPAPRAAPEPAPRAAMEPAAQVPTEAAPGSAREEIAGDGAEPGAAVAAKRRPGRPRRKLVHIAEPQSEDAAEDTAGEPADGDPVTP